MKKNLVLFLVLIVSELFSQDRIYFEHLTTDEGLSQNDVNCIYQDKQGFMWFGTHDGLNKYDGYSFMAYKPKLNDSSSISSNLIYSIDGDKNDNLWIGTTGSGIDFFNKSTEEFTHFKHDDSNSNSILNNHIISVKVDSKNRLWVGSKLGLNMLDLNISNNKKFIKFELIDNSGINGLEAKGVEAIFEDSEQQIWVGGSKGLFKLVRDDNGEMYFKCYNSYTKIYTPVLSVNEDNEGRMLVGTYAGLFVFDKNQTAKYNIIYRRNIRGIVVDSDNKIWGGTGQGLVLFENDEKTNLPIVKNVYTVNTLGEGNLNKNVIHSMYKDKTGIIWLGTKGGGVNKFDANRKRFLHIKNTPNPNSISYDNVRTIFEDSNGDLWFGTYGGELNKLSSRDDDGNYNKFQSFDNIRNIFAINEVVQKGKKFLYFGSELGSSIRRLDITKNKKISENDFKDVSGGHKGSVFSILTDTNNNLWFGTYNHGVIRWLYDVRTNSYTKSNVKFNSSEKKGLPSLIIRDLIEDRKGNIWIATGDGLCFLSKSEIFKTHPTIKIYKNDKNDNNSISHNYILSLFESSKGELWVGTFGGGLNKFIPGNSETKASFKYYTEENGFPNNVIKGILEDDNGNLWISSNKGLTVFNPQTESIKNYNKNDGLQSNEFQEISCLKRQNGEMLFGGINGVNTFYPNNILDNTKAAETVITNFSILNKEVKTGEEINKRVILDSSINLKKEIELKYSENNFSFGFSALHYAASRKNKFEYKLEGFDEDWVSVSPKIRIASYTNISPGKYKFKVKASNNDGVWDKTPAEIKLTIIPPFWRTNEAYFIYTLIFISLLMAFRRFTIISTTKKHDLEIEHLDKERYEELQKAKLEFFTNISHEFRTPLTLIKGPLDFLEKNKEILDKESVEEQYKLIRKNTNYLTRLVDQLLDFRKINQGKMRLFVRQGNIVRFINQMGESFQFLSSKQNVEFKINSSSDNIQAWFDPDAMEKILNNLLSNAFKFTPKGGKVIVEIFEGKSYLENNSAKSNCVIINIKDSGPGLSDSLKDHLFERFYVENNRFKNYKGAGIGLAFTKNLVGLHKGSIDVLSESNEGTTFTVTLPLDKKVYLEAEGISIDYDELRNEGEEDKSLEKIDALDEIEDKKLENNRSKMPLLLVVDDNADIRSFIKRTLRDNYDIIEAENGKHGLETAIKYLPNIILTDILMPIMDGLEMCEKLKTQKETSHIPIVMLTAKLSQESELQSLRIGADDYIRKPFDFELLKIKLTNIINYRDELRRKFNREITLEPEEVTVTSTDEKVLQQAIEIVEKNMMNTEFNVEMLVKEMGLSRSNLYLKLKELTGLSSSEFIRSVRLKRAVQLFEKSDLSVKEIMYMTGFNTASYFARCFKKQFGVNPSEYVRQGNVNKTDETVE